MNKKLSIGIALIAVFTVFGFLNFRKAQIGRAHV